MFGVVLAPIISSKLPQNVCLNLLRRVEGRTAKADCDMVLFDLDKLMAELLSEIRSLEICKISVNQNTGPATGSQQQPKRPLGSITNTGASTKSFVTTAYDRQNVGASDTRECCFCAKPHASKNCRIVKESAKRHFITSRA